MEINHCADLARRDSSLPDIERLKDATHIGRQMGFGRSIV
jgi:hypothetical protein